MVEAPLELQKSLTIPQGHYDACAVGKIATAGNAAANTKDFLDLSGANAAPGPLPAGFTPKGIVAMTFSILAALLGMATITWYVSSLLHAATITDCHLGMEWPIWEKLVRKKKTADLQQSLFLRNEFSLMLKPSEEK